MNEPAKKNQIGLFEIEYKDNDRDIFLTVYADTVAYDNDGGKNILIAIRFGGYSEQVRAMADVIYGGGKIAVILNKKTIYISGLTKRYRKFITNEGIYTEATLIAENGTLKLEDNDADKSILQTKYIFCENNSRNSLFEGIDNILSVPLITEFKDCLIDKLMRREILRRVNVLSVKNEFDVWKILISPNESNIISVVEEGLKKGEISIPNSAKDNEIFNEIGSVSSYLNTFGAVIARKIKNQFNPLFEPSKEELSNEILNANQNIKEHAGYELYNAQQAVAEAMKRRLDKNKFALCVAECGTGKTKIGLTALQAHQRGKGKKKCFNIVLCPAHLPKKWLREINESLPNAFSVHIKNIYELNKAFEIYEQNDKDCYVVLTKEKARDGYMKRPAVIYSELKKAFLCPDCYAPIMMNVFSGSTKYEEKADQFFFKRENSQNHKCSKCGSVLWTVLQPKKQRQWIKVSNYGYVYKSKAIEHANRLFIKALRANPGKSIEEINFPKVYYEIKKIVKEPDGEFTAAGAHRRYPISSYIAKKMNGKIDGLIIDELQDYNNNSGQGDAMNELLGCAKKAIGLTGTLINGYSQGVFYLLYRISPYLMQIDGKKFKSTQDFNNEYGVTESVYEMDYSDYNSNRRTVKRKIREKQLPGVSPLVYSRFLMNSSVFLSLNDMGKQLPEYEEIPVQLELPDEVFKEYRRIEKFFIDVMKYRKDIAQKVMSAFVSLLTVYPDQPYDTPGIVEPLTGKEMIKTKDTFEPEELSEKDKWILDKVKEKISKGERVVVYTSWIKIDTQERLEKLFNKNNIKCCVLRSSVATTKREEWINAQVEEGVHVLITNPQLLETGLDLNDFTTLIYYNISYKLFTLRQSSRRSWRINQRAPRIEVYFLYYKDVMQHRAIRLMASKLAVAGIIEGNLTDEGLAAMSECQDLTTLLAQELTLGLKNEAEDLGDIFKKMAFIKPENINVLEQEEHAEREPSEILNQTDNTLVDCVETNENNFSGIEIKFKKDKKKVKSPKYLIEGQISIFDFSENISA